jgi:Ion channel
MSGTTFFTLGLGDVTPSSTTARFITVTESGMGFGFLALVIGYVPILYQSFSRREATITLMDARAGSPPSALELFRRHSSDDGHRELRELFRDWERWSADILESHLSYPVLCYYRSQHDNENWLATLTTILDACALVIVGEDDSCRHQAQLTFAMARHTVVDLSQIFLNKPEVKLNRLSQEQIPGLRTALAEAGWRMQEGSAAEEHLIELRKMYEPFVEALGAHMLFSIPGWFPPQRLRDNWQTSAWGRITGGVANPSVCETKGDGHF